MPIKASEFLTNMYSDNVDVKSCKRCFSSFNDCIHKNLLLPDFVIYKSIWLNLYNYIFYKIGREIDLEIERRIK